MRFLLLILCGCHTLDCEYPIAEAIPENTEMISCEPLEEGCSPDIQYCKGTYTYTYSSGFTGTSYVYWIRHLNENLLCDKYDDCEVALDTINEWCRAYPECWRADRLPEWENCDATDCG